MPHPLDRPIWSALTTRQAHLAVGDGRALRFDADFALFAAAADAGPEATAAMSALIPEEGVVGLVEAGAVALPPGARVVTEAACVQMTLTSLTPARGPEPDWIDLGEPDAPEMLALATLTEPGPFFAKTHQLGAFVGVRIGGRLAAMAGERMKPDGFTEVSGVCAHPDFRGRGLAAALMRIVTERILARGETPFLHAYAHKPQALALHQGVGFTVRSPVTFTVLSRRDDDERTYGHG
ncbi:MAG TPA: GNAT family N-acetyltransferase [Brevundimonas sp.]|jgi:predicted GNAT family acetyltransferase|uniref:GNAT family N-acetyltransferase n=1 Tax=Brevundimonas sp. TaxID=1871086 RepID=UPI002DED43B7|nr:GNAT family N-acetyltransferase [Brevundimonas sp.]